MCCCYVPLSGIFVVYYCIYRFLNAARWCLNQLLKRQETFLCFVMIPQRACPLSWAMALVCSVALSFVIFMAFLCMGAAAFGVTAAAGIAIISPLSGYIFQVVFMCYWLSSILYHLLMGTTYYWLSAFRTYGFYWEIFSFLLYKRYSPNVDKVRQYIDNSFNEWSKP